MYNTKSSNSRTQIGKALYIFGFVLIVMVAIAVGGVGQDPIKADPNQDNAVVSSESGSQVVEGISTGAKIQSISFKKDWAIRDALQFLAARYQKNIVPSTKVDGLITVTSLYDVTFEEALEAILGHSFKYEQQGNFIKVYTADEYKQIKEDKERMIYQVFTLYYITAEEAATLIKPVISDSAKVEKSSPAEKKISGGSGGSSGSGGAGGSLGSGGGGDTLALNDTIVVYDFPEKISKVEEVIKALDVKPKQVLVEATILSALLDEDMDLGIDWNFLNGTRLTGSLTQIAGLTTGTPIETGGFAIPGNGLRVGFTSGDLVGFIRALETITDVTVLANPKILAINKQQGSLLIGNKIGYNSQTTQTDGGTVTSKVDFFESGTRLVFRPYIGNDGYIRMEIYPKDSSAELNPTTQAPDETTTELQTNILVKDGQTVVIGGLFRDVVSTTRNQVPLLGNIPLIGVLFSGQTDLTQREEVIVMLTPHIIEEPEETNGISAEADVSRKRLGAKEEMHSISRRKMAEDRYVNAVKYYLGGDNESAMRQLATALNLRPTYLEALRLKEKIIADTKPEDVKKLERIMLEVIDQQEASKWMRR